MKRAAAATAGAGAALLLAAPSPAAALRTLGTASDAADPAAPLLSLVALAAWALLGWLLLIAAITCFARTPGRRGRAAARLVRWVAPAGVRRFVELTLGVTVVVGGLGAGPAAAGTHVPPGPPATVSLDWPTPPPPAAPSLDWPPAVAHRQPAPQRPAPQRLAPVVVRPGDSLWAIAAAHLPAGSDEAQIAQAWPSWWSANRAAIGADPDLIHPGLSLTPPTQH